MRVFLRILRVLFGLILLVAFVVGFYCCYSVAPKSLELDEAAAEVSAVPEVTPEAVEQPADEETPAVEAASGTEPAEAAETESIEAEIESLVTEEPANEEISAEAGEPTAEISLPDIDVTSWEFLLVNAENPLDSDYAPSELVTVEQQQFDSRVADALDSMIEAARAEGVNIYLSSGYQDYSTQQYLYNRLLGQGYTEEEAAAMEACPGTSEHQTGLCCDITDKYYEAKDSGTLADNATSIWLREHCAEYGFIIRYPADKEDITGVGYMPWHVRYVGVEAASCIMDNNLCLEEFLALYQ